MKLLSCGLLVAMIFLFVGCAPGRYMQQTEIGIANFWQYLDVSIVRGNQGAKLQFFSQDRTSNFIDVFVTYTIFTDENIQPETRLIRLDTNGRAVTTPCSLVYPRITQISGVVEHLQRN